MSAVRRIEPLLLVPLAIALGLRLWGIGWGLPAVYEEAYPFKKAWDMWGWGPSRGLDLNPHFFNYPTLFFYVQFLGQGLLFVVLKASGHIASALDFRVLYELDKTSFYLLGRSIAALCGAATVAATFAVARRAAGSWAAAMAASLVAVNQMHITKSQAIEVDVPMTLLSTLCMLFALRIAAGGGRRDYILAGLCGGLATSTKYNGALLGLSIVVAHVIATRFAGSPPAALPVRGRPAARAASPARSHGELIVAGAVFIAAFLLTSPYVLLDHQAFWLGFNYERAHMRIGHFGLDDTPTFLWYLRVFTRTLLGWPQALLAGAGLVWFVAVRRRTWAIVLAAFPVAYLALLSSWSMKADRYMIPLLPVAATFASAFVVEQLAHLRGRGARLPILAAVLATVAMAAPSLYAAVQQRARLRGDTRTLARQWIEANVAPGSCLVIEPYGPEPVGIIDVFNWPADIRARVYDRIPNLRVYAVVAMPMFQVKSENSAIFYNPALYDGVADIIVTSSSVASRYKKDPQLYAAQAAFYDTLETRWIKRREFGPQDGSGPRVTIWGNPHGLPPFAARRELALPPPPPVVPDLLPGTFAGYFDRLAFNYEGYGFYDHAAAVYGMGLRYPDQPPVLRRSLFMGAIRNSLSAGRTQQALAIVAEGERSLPREAAAWSRIRTQIASRAARADTSVVR
jgi:hypothetical protein